MSETLTGTTTFAIRTDDTAWITRNHGTIGEAGRIFVQVPADQVERVTFCGKAMLRHTFADAPADTLNAAIVCPAIWVELAEVTAQRPEALDGKALFLAKARAAGIVR